VSIQSTREKSATSQPQMWNLRKSHNFSSITKNPHRLLFTHLQGNKRCLAAMENMVFSFHQSVHHSEQWNIFLSGHK
jgi:hypothetical protein